MTQRSRILSIDVGTSSVKAAIFNGDAALVNEVSVGYPLVQPQPGWVEQDPQVLWNAFQKALTDVLRKAEVLPEVLVLSTAMHALMAVNETDEPMTRLVTWADQRAESIAKGLRSVPIGLTLYHKTGTPIHTMSPLVKLAWFRNNMPDVFAKAKVWADLKSFLLWKLTGSWIIDRSIASATGLYNLSTGDWDQEALDWCGIKHEQLPTLVQTTDIFPIKRSLAETLGLPLNTRIVAGASDGALANLGVGAIKPGSLAVSIGTSGAVRGIVREPQLDPEGRLFCYVVDEGHFIIGGPINNGGILLRWLQSVLSGGNGEDSEQLGSDSEALKNFLLQLNREVSKVAAGSEGLFCLPYLTGERAPIWRGDISGSLWGLKLSHTRSHLMRAILEGICYQLNSVVKLLTSLTGTVQVVNATGGFTESQIWLEILSNILDLPLQVPEHTQGSALGGAFMAWFALGELAELESAADLVPISRLQTPNTLSANRYREGYALFKELVALSEQQFSKLDEFARGGSIND